MGGEPLSAQGAERGPPPVADQERPKQWSVSEQALRRGPLGDAHPSPSIDRRSAASLSARVVGDAAGRPDRRWSSAYSPAGSVAHGAEMLTTRLRGAGGGVDRLRRVSQPCLVRAIGRRRCVARRRALSSSRRVGASAEGLVARRSPGCVTAAVQACRRTRRPPHRCSLGTRSEVAPVSKPS